MGEHAVLAPSSSAQWGHCSGSIMAQAQHPDRETEQTREGTAAHWVMAEVLLNWRDNRGGPRTCDGYVGQIAPNGVLIDDKMAEGAQVMVEEVLGVCERYAALHLLLVEYRVYMPGIHNQNWGTLDCSLFLQHLGLMFIWDYKHGHREAPAVDNFQMADYLNGLCNLHQIDGAAEQRIRFVSRIVQPYCYYATGPVREWSGLLSDLRGVWNQLSYKAHEAFTNPTLTTGIWCRDCSARGTCTAARKAGYNLIDLVNEPYEMDEMGGADLAVERAILRDGLAVGEARLEAIEDELQHRIKNGETDSGLTVETTYGRWNWNVDVAQARALASQFGIDITVDAIKTPTQTVAAAPKELRPHLKEVMKQMTRRSAGSLTLVPADESRTARAFKRKDNATI